MNQFQVTVVNQGRSVIAVLLFSFSILLGVYLAITMETTILKIFAPITAIAIINLLSIYFTVSTLTIRTDNKSLSFEWSNKLFLNFKPIEKLGIEEIRTLVINTLPGEQKEHLLLIRTDNRKIKISTPKYWRKDTDAFIQYLKDNSNAEIKDSWDMLKEQGLLSIPYYAISFILIAGVLVITYVVFDKGLSNAKPQHLFGFVGSYLTLIPFWFIIRSKMKEGDNRR